MKTFFCLFKPLFIFFSTFPLLAQEVNYFHRTTEFSSFIQDQRSHYTQFLDLGDPLLIEALDIRVVGLQGGVYSIFNRQERIRIQLMAEDYIGVLTYVSDLDLVGNYAPYMVDGQPLLSPPFQTKGSPANEAIVDFFNENKQNIQINIRQSDLSFHDIEFLILYTEYLAEEDGYISMKELNEKSESFMKNFRSSPLFDYVQKQMHYDFEPAPVSLGMYIGGSYAPLQGSVSDYFSSLFYFDVGADMRIRNQWILSFNMTIGGAENQFDSLQWRDESLEKDSATVHSAIHLSLGYVLNPKNRLQIAPIAGLTWSSLEQPGMDIRSHQASGFHYGMELYLFNRPVFHRHFNGSSSSLRLRVARHNFTHASDEMLNGSQWSFSLNYGMRIGQFRRKLHEPRQGFFFN